MPVIRILVMEWVWRVRRFLPWADTMSASWSLFASASPSPSFGASQSLTSSPAPLTCDVNGEAVCNVQLDSCLDYPGSNPCTCRGAYVTCLINLRCPFVVIEQNVLACENAGCPDVVCDPFYTSESGTGCGVVHSVRGCGAVVCARRWSRVPRSRCCFSVSSWTRA